MNLIRDGTKNEMVFTNHNSRCRNWRTTEQKPVREKKSKSNKKNKK